MRYRSKMYDIPVEQREKILALDKKWSELLKIQCNRFEEIGSKYPHAWNDIVKCVENHEIAVENVTQNHPEVLASDLINLCKGRDTWQAAHNECFDYAEKRGIEGLDIMAYKDDITNGMAYLESLSNEEKMKLLYTAFSVDSAKQEYIDKKKQFDRLLLQHNINEDMFMDYCTRHISFFGNLDL